MQSFLWMKLEIRYTERIWAKKEDWGALLDSLPPDNCRWAVYFFNYDETKKIVFISWIPKSATNGEKSRYERSTPSLKRFFGAKIVELVGEQRDDLGWGFVEEKVFGQVVGMHVKSANKRN
uniref:ADF-H domain-containing protein n=1 Tax=Paramoeba aestuarina TaxID=180227 RepID=A0A7S4KMA9_9EUKA|mmetsp:Transcript_21662/g.33659  ORF Transcript_21662/g.33659 Transcript_21662/m.33659 type:complete len:121 (+) Transcript_21662:130-492(+)